MIGKRKIIVMLSALIFSLGVFSVGFGYWTDQLNLEGDANVRLSINVTDDIIKVEYTTPDAVQLLENQIAPDPVSEPPTDSSVPEDTEQNESDGTSISGDKENPTDLNSDLVPDSTEQTGSQDNPVVDSDSLVPSTGDNPGESDSSSGTGETTTTQTSPNNDGAGEGSIEE